MKKIYHCRHIVCSDGGRYPSRVTRSLQVTKYMLITVITDDGPYHTETFRPRCFHQHHWHSSNLQPLTLIKTISTDWGSTFFSSAICHFKCTLQESCLTSNAQATNRWSTRGECRWTKINLYRLQDTGCVKALHFENFNPGDIIEYRLAVMDMPVSIVTLCARSFSSKIFCFERLSPAAFLSAGNLFHALWISSSLSLTTLW